MHYEKLTRGCPTEHVEGTGVSPRLSLSMVRETKSLDH